MLASMELNPLKPMKQFAHMLLCLSALLLLAAPAAVASSPAGKKISARLHTLLHRSNGVYSVAEAAAAGDVATLRTRLAEGEDPSLVDEMGNSPLHHAAKGDSPHILNILLEAGADPLARDSQGRTPRQLCRNQTLTAPLKAAEQRRAGELALAAMVSKRDETGVRAALANGVNPDARTQDHKTTLLQHAVLLGHGGIAQALITAGANVNATTLPTRQSALHYAAAKGDAELIGTLLAAKADPMLQAANGAYALHDAIWNRHQEAVRALLPAYAAVNFNPKGGPHGSPLAMAIHYGRTEIVRAFLEAGFNPNDVRLADEPLLILAVRRGHADCVKLLLDAGANKHTRDAHGMTAADYAPSDLGALLR